MIFRKTLVACVLVLGLFGNAIADLNSGLVAYYPFDGNAKDTIGNNNGNEQGGVSYVSGKDGQAANFNGVDSEIILGNWNLPTSGTLSLWIKQSGFMNNPENWYQGIFGKWSGTDSCTQYPFRLALADNPKKIDFAISNPTCDFSSVHSKTTLLSNIWYHIVLEWGDSVNLYINGKLEGNTKARFAMMGNETISVGRWHGSLPGWGWLEGQIDDLRVYNRILTESEIQRLYTISGSNSTSSCVSPKAVTVSENLDIQIPSLNYTSLLGTQNLWANLKYYGKGSNGEILWKLKDFGTNP